MPKAKKSALDRRDLLLQGDGVVSSAWEFVGAVIARQVAAESATEAGVERRGPTQCGRLANP